MAAVFAPNTSQSSANLSVEAEQQAYYSYSQMKREARSETRVIQKKFN